jgi:hypothetical protein
MDTVPVCDGKRESGHLKRFFLFLLVDAQGLVQVTTLHIEPYRSEPERLKPCRERVRLQSLFCMYRI